jgi:type II secretory ATPase GspE/PulE/Tfp pilus assembly ATPase PilB-like protein
MPPLAPSSTIAAELEKGAGVSIIALVDCLIEEAHRARASDIHIDPSHQGLTVRFRVDGVLREAYRLPASVHDEVISRIKILAGLRTDEHQAAQDGRFRTTVQGANVDMRVSCVPTYYGENAVMRLLPEVTDNFTLESLGFTPENRDKILTAVKKSHGMILVTGPTGSGKTTTLYTLVKVLNKPDVSILTIEEPVEYAITGVNQIPVNARTGLTFATGLRSMLRQDPNIIMVGEIRDAETASIAVNTALTGHLLLSTLHTNDAATTLPRLLDMKVEPYLIASTVNIAVAQRLVRRICQACKETRPMTALEKASLAELLPARALEGEHTVSKGKGCEHCGGMGYSGRIGIHEVMVIDGPVRDAVLKKVSAADMRALALERGMISMLEDGFKKACAGETTIEDVLRVVHE